MEKSPEIPQARRAKRIRAHSTNNSHRLSFTTASCLVDARLPGQHHGTLLRGNVAPAKGVSRGEADAHMSDPCFEYTTNAPARQVQVQTSEVLETSEVWRSI
jgi:hypothetical protein